MQIAFAIIFFITVGLSETLRQGFFGLTPSDMKAIIYGALILGALLLLRGDIISTIRRPRQPLYGHEHLNWTWPRTLLGVFLGPLLWALPAAYGFAVMRLDVNPIVPDLLISAIVLQVFLVGIAEGLFFREAAVKAFGADAMQTFAISTLALFIFYIPLGVPEAMIAAGAGLFFLTLRMIGSNVFVVAVIHGATVVIFGQVISLALTEAEMWSYAVFFASAATALSLTVFMLFASQREEERYA